MADLLDTLAGLPPVLTYLILGLGAAVENILPPVPADTFVLFGAFLAASGRADAWLVLLVTWAANVGSALVVYRLALRYGRDFFDTRVGGWILQPEQLRQVDDFYSRWGTPAIFMSRFLPGFRAVVPVFAGVSGLRFWPTALPIASASALWYGMLVYIGATIGDNWRAILDAFGRISAPLLWVALAFVAALALWWWRSRRREPGE